MMNRSKPVKKRSSTPTVSREGEWCVAQCMQVDVASQGVTEDEALDNLRDALDLHFTTPVATIVPHLRNIEVEMQINAESKEARAKRLWKRKVRTLKAFQTTFENRRR